MKIRWITAGFALMACAGGPSLQPEPVEAELLALSTAIEQAEAAEALLEAGQAREAAEAFARAAEAREDEPLLRAWQAVALAQAGERAAALALADRVLQAAPDLHALRWQRAQWRMGAGQVELAVQEVAALLAADHLQASQVWAAPAFATSRDDPRVQTLPGARVSGEWALPSGTVFAGSIAALTLRVEGHKGQPTTTSLAAVGPADVVRVVETVEGDSRSVRWELRAEGAGRVELSQQSLSYASGAVDVPAAEITLSAPSTAPVAAAHALTLPWPSAQLAVHAPDGLPAMWREGAWTYVAIGPEHTAAVLPTRVRPVAEWSLRGETPRKGTVRVYPSEGVKSVEVLSGDAVLLRGP